MESPELQKVIRLDSIPLEKASFTEEGYLIDFPIVTSVGIFEYKNEDGSTRRELRLPEHVFEEESLASYEGKPIIITHDAGRIDKDNVEENSIGTILSKGIPDGDNVRAKIVIHNTDAMREANLKELSLGYGLTLVNKPGVWNGQPYDAIQTNIRVNHLALVLRARAGDQARLNIDSRENNDEGGTNQMEENKSTHAVDPSVVEAFKARRAERLAAKQQDSENQPAAVGNPETSDNPVFDTPPAEGTTEKDSEGVTAEEQTAMVKERRDRRDSCGDPANLDEAMEQIAQQDEDIDTLLALLESLCAQKQDEDDTVPPDSGAECGEGESSDGQCDPLNADSIDAVVKERVNLIMMAKELNLDGAENKSNLEIRKMAIHALNPELRLDGQSDRYIKVAYDFAVAQKRKRKDTNYQRQQMMNKDSREIGKAISSAGSNASDARANMIARRNKGGNK